MAGIYIHFPFCITRCNYCDFYSTVKTQKNCRYIEVLKKETESMTAYLKNEIVKTIYFGGGTPSLLEASEIADILEHLKKNFIVSKNPEITLEVNPDDHRENYFKSIISVGINRISIGVQSLDNGVLKILGRRHTARQVYDCIDGVIMGGIKNIGIDLIYGIPGMTCKTWKLTLNKVFKLPIHHLSAYHLTYEKGTVLYKLLSKGEISLINEEESWKQFEIIDKTAFDNGFEHYEISNFAKKGYYSKHNANYWNGTTYLGLGPSAHSYNGRSRRWNCSDLNRYMNLVNSNDLYYEEEILTNQDKANEFLLTGLRTSTGIDFDYVKNSFGEKYLKKLSERFEKFVNSGHARNENHSGYLTLKGWFISDKIISDLMI
jgi:oxygen-independent coproporphyrinogen III oxidase